MENIELKMDRSATEIILVLCISILLSLLLAEMCDWTRRFFSCDGDHFCSYAYTYKEFNGPSTWKERFLIGDKQSPIHITSNNAIVVPVETFPPLTFSEEYELPPSYLKVYNDGHCLSFYARWPGDNRPTISGGPLKDRYVFLNARLRWGGGENDAEGSEHAIDCHTYGMELQAIHVKESANYRDLREAAKDNGVLIISYFFEEGSDDNPCLKSLTSVLKTITCPFACTVTEPELFAHLIRPFCSQYYTYSGSLTFPPCTEGVLWMIQPEPVVPISSRQVRKFRKLVGVDGIINANLRPRQEINSRNIFFYC